jgi:hypothetical protein
LRESSGFTVDDIDEVAVNLQEALEANQEISHAINAPGRKFCNHPNLWILHPVSTIYVWGTRFLFTVSQGIDDEDSLEAELAAFLKTDPSEVSVAGATGGLISSIKQTTTTDEDDLEARLAALSIGAGQREKGTADSGQVESEGRDKTHTSTKRSKLQPLPA